MLLAGGAAGFAYRRQWADTTARDPRQAHRGAQFHHGLIERARLPAIQPLLRDLAKTRARAAGGNIGRIVGQPRDDARDISVQHGIRQAEGDARNRGGGVVAHARELSYGLVAAGKKATHLARGFMQIAGSRIVAEAAPTRQNLFRGSGRQRCDAGKALQESFVIGDHSLRASLLQHDLGDPGVPTKQLGGERTRRNHSSV